MKRILLILIIVLELMFITYVYWPRSIETEPYVGPVITPDMIPKGGDVNINYNENSSIAFL